MQLTQIEAAFQSLKSDLDIRPIHHQLEHRVEAHILVAFLAYCLTVTVKHQLRVHAPGLTPRAVLEKLATIQMLDVCFPTTDGRRLVMPLHRAEPRAGTDTPSTEAGSTAATSSAHHPCCLVSSLSPTQNVVEPHEVPSLEKKGHSGLKCT
ncbi:MAG: hypothetical protein JJE04_11730 [Acidobacteriia bacterium]|nr:hypothetical protein [Terriglobia bacterium]